MVALQHDLEIGVVQDARRELGMSIGFAFVSGIGKYLAGSTVVDAHLENAAKIAEAGG